MNLAYDSLDQLVLVSSPLMAYDSLDELVLLGQDAFDPNEKRDEKGEWADHGSFTLYHGSQFGGLKKFDKAKIGSGEGFQTYGNGFYLARNKQVAESYKNAGDHFPLDSGVLINGSLRRTADMKAAETFAYRNLLDDGGDIDKAIEDLSGGDPHHVYDKEYADALPFLKQWKAQGATLQTGGNIYTVEAKADPDAFFDWDKPIAAQPEGVKKVFGPKLMSGGGPAGMMTHKLRKGWESAMAALGVPGIRYFDEGSRLSDYAQKFVDKAGDRQKALAVVQQRLKQASLGEIRHWQALVDEIGKPVTRNYVVFDPKTLSVTHRNGQPLTQGEASDAMMGLDAFNPDEPRVTGGKGGGEWTKGGGGPSEFRDLAEQQRQEREANAPPANLEGDTPEAKAKTARIREIAKQTGVDPRKFYYGGPPLKMELAGMTGETMGVTFNKPSVFNGKRFPPGVVIFDAPANVSPTGEPLAGTIAHEAMHVKFNAVMNALSDEAAKISRGEVDYDGIPVPSARARASRSSARRRSALEKARRSTAMGSIWRAIKRLPTATAILGMSTQRTAEFLSTAVYLS